MGYCHLEDAYEEEDNSYIDRLANMHNKKRKNKNVISTDSSKYFSAESSSDDSIFSETIRSEEVCNKKKINKNYKKDCLESEDTSDNSSYEIMSEDIIQDNNKIIKKNNILINKLKENNYRFFSSKEYIFISLLCVIFLLLIDLVISVVI